MKTINHYTDNILCPRLHLFLFNALVHSTVYFLLLEKYFDASFIMSSLFMYGS